MALRWAADFNRQGQHLRIPRGPQKKETILALYYFLPIYLCLFVHPEIYHVIVYYPPLQATEIIRDALQSLRLLLRIYAIEAACVVPSSLQYLGTH